MAFIGRMGSAASGDAAEHERHYAHFHVLVDAGEPLDLDVHAGLFEDLAAYAVLERLVQFQYPTGWLPLAVVSAPDREHTIVLIEHDTCDADGVAGKVGHWNLTMAMVLFDAAIESWCENHLSPGDMIKVRTARDRDRDQYAVTVNLPGGKVRTLEPGAASLILKGVIEQWAPARLGDPVVLTISEPGKKLVVADNETPLAAGLNINASLLLCDALLVDLATKPVTFWIVEAVASDGPIDEDRKRQFLRWAEDNRIPAAACRFLTAFSSRHSASSRRRLKDLAAGTYAWYADEPHHELAWYEVNAGG